MITSTDPATAIEQAKARLAITPSLPSLIITIPAGDYEIFRDGHVIRRGAPNSTR